MSLSSRVATSELRVRSPAIINRQGKSAILAIAAINTS
jgi:hypothetical protein